MIFSKNLFFFLNDVQMFLSFLSRKLSKSPKRVIQRQRIVRGKSSFPRKQFQRTTPRGWRNGIYENAMPRWWYNRSHYRSAKQSISRIPREMH